MYVRCMLDQSVDNVFFCEGCNFYICDRCWDAFPPHAQNTLGAADTPHMRLSHEIQQSLKESLAAPIDDKDQFEKHQDDLDTTWFGLDKDEGGEPVLSEYRRYASLMMDCMQDASDRRFPRLVSFIGETGAGKSSLIRLLMNIIGPQLSSSTSEQADSTSSAMPVIGRSGSDSPTSTDVHLYIDPKLRASNRPILYADCEGFRGGERSVAADSKQEAAAHDKKPAAADDRVGTVSDLPHVLRRWGSQARRRTLRWARRDKEDFQTTSKRTFAIGEMYPRIFYAFSDVVVFVLPNPKTLEVVVEELLKWADVNCSKSANLPSRPHVIIVLNKCEAGTAMEQFDPLTARAHLLTSANANLKRNNTFMKYADLWGKAGARPEDMLDLLKRYYSSVHTVRIPWKNRQGLLHAQVSKLYDIMVDCCEKSSETKAEKRMLPDVDEFGLYLSLAFDHFSESLEVPFDFVKASLQNEPPPETLYDTIWNFTMMIHKERPDLQGRAAQLFDLLTPIIASCIVLDSQRKQRIGYAADWFDVGVGGDKAVSPSSRQADEASLGKGAKSYRANCEDVLQKYYGRCVPCDFIIESTGRSLPCQNAQITHDRHAYYHIFSNITYYKGAFQSSFDRTHYGWGNRILSQMTFLQSTQERDAPSEGRRRGALAHRQSVREFYKDAGGANNFISHAICLCCLSNPPENHLACGHVICFECALDFGHHREAHTIIIDECPLCPDYGQERLKESPTIIKRPPIHSGMRVLTLDGGGIRGIVELLILQALERQLGLPIQSFFDLVVGTSTGGIVALALGDQGHLVTDTIVTFKTLVRLAFTKRKGQGVKIVKWLQRYIKRSSYETKPLEAALQQVFPPAAVLFGRRDTDLQSNQRLKVTVTATSGTGSRGYVLSNYNTRLSKSVAQHSLPCSRYRPDCAEDELLVWEAARSTSAAPGFFKPYKKQSGQAFPELIDGGLLQNNPVALALEEARSLAKTYTQRVDPDIIVSIGTGLPRKYHDDPGSAPPTTMTRSALSPLKVLYSIVSFQIQLNLDSEGKFRDMCALESGLRTRLHRINPWLGIDPPEMDDKDAVLDTAQRVEKLLNKVEVQRQIAAVACSLFASSFYLATNTPTLERRSSTQLRGTISCRLQGETRLVRDLGKSLDRCTEPPMFVVQSISQSGREQHEELPLPIQEMKRDGSFETLPVVLEVPGEDVETNIALRLPGLSPARRLLPISGFPRSLLQHDMRTQQH